MAQNGQIKVRDRVQILFGEIQLKRESLKTIPMDLRPDLVGKIGIVTFVGHDAVGDNFQLDIEGKISDIIFRPLQLELLPTDESDFIIPARNVYQYKDMLYNVLETIKVKVYDGQDGSWVSHIIYQSLQTGVKYGREKIDFLTKFKKVNYGS